MSQCVGCIIYHPGPKLQSRDRGLGGENFWGVRCDTPIFAHETRWDWSVRTQRTEGVGSPTDFHVPYYTTVPWSFSVSGGISPIVDFCLEGTATPLSSRGLSSHGPGYLRRYTHSPTYVPSHTYTSSRTYAPVYTHTHGFHPTHARVPRLLPGHLSWTFPLNR